MPAVKDAPGLAEALEVNAGIPDPALHRPLTRRYVSALALIAMLSIGSHLALQRLVATQSTAAAEVNVSGRQRMLSQRIALHASLLAAGEDQRASAALRATLADLADLMAESHAGLLDGDPRLGLPGRPSPALRDLYRSPPTNLDARVREYLTDVRALVATAEGDDAALAERSDTVVAAARGELLPALDAAVSAYQAESEAEIAGLQRVALAVLATTMVVLLLEGLLVFRPMSARIRRHTERITAAEAWLRSVVDNVLVGVLTVDGKGRITSCNRTGAALFGYRPEQVEGLALTALAEPGEPAARLQRLWEESVDGRPPARLEMVARRADGTTFAAEVAAALAAGNQPTVTVLMADVTERRAFEEQLTFAAFHDPLTGLPNRALFLDRLDRALTRREASTIAVLFCDLDDFKDVNDRLGHAAGDAVLVAVGERLSASLRTGDTAARLGGDEFAVLLEGVDHPDQVAVVTRRMLEALQQPLIVASTPVTVSASVGVVVPTKGRHLTAEALLRDADTAMYVAKSRGKGRSEIFAPSMEPAAGT